MRAAVLRDFKTPLAIQDVAVPKAADFVSGRDCRIRESPWSTILRAVSPS
jgi:hypothetical protein